MMRHAWAIAPVSALNASADRAILTCRYKMSPGTYHADEGLRSSSCHSAKAVRANNQPGVKAYRDIPE